MYTVAYKWRLTTNKYAYITSTEYRKDNSDPNFTLSFIGEKLPSNDEYIIKEKVRLMSSDEYRQCFEYMQTKIALDSDGQYIKLKNWEYYYHFNNDENGDNDFLVVEATATAKKSEDGNAYASVVNENGVLKFSFEIPYGLDGKNGADGKDGLKGEPGEDSKSSESIYKITKNNSYDRFFPETWFNEIDYQKDDYVPSQHGWSDRPSGITSDYRYEWVSTRKYNTTTKSWEQFSKPVLMSRWGEDGKDGDGIEYVYKGTNDEIAPLLTIPENYINDEEYQKDDFIPNGWLDTPEGVNSMGKKYVWVSQRKEKNGIWEPFSYPALWSKWGEDGNGVEYVYFVTNSDIAPEIDEYDVNSDEYQNTEFLPSTKGEKWSDEYVEPTVTNQFSWFSMRKYKNGAWEAFSEPKIWNTYKISGKFIVELFTRSNNVLDYYDLPYYDNEIYYSFVENKFFTDKDKTNVLDNITSFNKNVRWETGIPIEVSKKYLYKTSAIVDVQKDYDELMQITSDKWCGPFIVATNGENAINNAPYVIFDDSSLSLPIKKEDNHPHEAYYYSFNAKLYFSDTQMEILNVSTKVSSSKIKNLTTKISKTDINTKVNDCNISFNIDNSQEFTTIETIYVTLNGTHEGKPIEGTGQFKIIPFMSEDAILYRILLSDKVIFIPSDTCSDDSGLGPWHINFSGVVVDNRGNNITLTDECVLNYKNKSGEYINLKDGLTLYNCNENIDYDTKGWVKISDLPNPLPISYTVWGKVRETEYVHFINMPVDGIDGISSRMVFAYTSTEENITPITPTGGSVDFITNTISEYPKSYDENGNECDYVWGSNDNLSGVVWLTQCEFFSDNTSDLTWSNPIRLTGFKGDSGISAYSIDLTNDMDQVYTTNNSVVITGQSVNTNVTLMCGVKPMALNANNVSISPVEGFEIKTDQESDENVKITFNLTGKTLTDKVYYFDININGDEYGISSYDFTKTFKVKVIDGTIDYDLNVYPTIVKRNKKGEYSHNQVNVKIMQRNLSVDNKNIATCSTIPDGYSLFYNFDDETKFNKINSYGSDGVSIKLTNDNFNKINIFLCNGSEYNEENVVDIAYVECVSDGSDGLNGSSAYFLELSNEYDRIATIDNKVFTDTVISTKVRVFLGIEDVTNKMEIVASTTDDFHFDYNPKNDTYDIIFWKGKTIDGDIDITFNAYDKYDTNDNTIYASKNMKIKKVGVHQQFDLNITPTYAVKHKNGTLSNNFININLTEIKLGDTTSKTDVTAIPENKKIEIKGKSSGLIETFNEATILPKNFDISKYADTSYIITLLNKKNDGTWDENDFDDKVVVEIITDGIDGKDGKSPYHIELSNDMDQILTVDGVVKYPQTIVTTLSLYNGFDKVTSLTKNDITLPTITNFNCEFGAVNNGDVEIKIIPTTGTSISVDKHYDFPIKISQNKTGLNFDITKIFKCVVLNSSVDYDLFVSHGIIKKTNVGYSTNNVNIKIKETDISRGDRSVNFLNTLSSNLHVDVYKDNNSTPLTGLNYGSDGIDINIATITPETKLVVKLLSGDTPIDVVDIDVVSDGKNGEPGVDGANIEFIYKLYKDEIEFQNDVENQPSGTGTKEDILANLSGWTDSPSGINEKYKVEVASQRNKNAGEKVWGEWHTAIWAKWGEDGIDGDGVEYIFQITNRGVEPNNPGGDIKSILSGYTDSTLSALTEIVNTFDFFPGEEWFETNKEYVTKLCKGTNVTYDDVKNLFDLNWSDNPSNVGPYEPLEWVSIRRKKVNLDGTFEYIYTEPTIWAEWKRDTYDSLTEFMFTIYDSRVDLSTVKISGGTWENIKNGDVYDIVKTLSGETKLTGITWQDSVPNHNMYTQSVWMVKGFASGKIEYTGDANKSGITYSEIEWTRPTKLIDNQHLQVEYGFEVIDSTGQSVVPNPINLQDIVSGLGLNYDYTKLENAFRENDKASGYDFRWTDNPTGESPTWMITSTFYNGVWSDWVVSKIKGEKGETGETGQSIQIKGSFETLEDLQNAYKYLKNGGTKPSKYFVDDKLIIGDSYIVNESVVNDETVYGYLYVYVKNDVDFDKAWEAVGQIKGMDGKDGVSSYIYIVYANELINNEYILTSGGTYGGKTYYGTTPGKYIGIHIAAQQYEGHPYPPKLYSASAITNTDETFLWNKWEGDDGFGQEQIFILSGETAPKVPVYNSKISGVTGITIWNSNDFVPEGWSDVPLTTSDSDNERCCWMATRRFPFNGDDVNNFKGDNYDNAILFSRYSKNGEDGNGIELIEEFYLASNSNSGVTTGTTGWKKTVVTTDKNNRYLWNYEKITYTNNNHHSTIPQVIGTYSEDGVGIKNITEFYQISDSNTNAPTTWVEKAPALTNEKKYLWNYEQITYSNGQTSKTVPVVIGVYGDKGLDGSSPFHVELNNDFDLVSVLNNKVNGEQTIKIEARLYEGNTPRDITGISIHNCENIEYSTSSKTQNDIGIKFYEITFTIPNGIGFNGIRNIVIRVNGKYDTYLTLKPLETTILYQLVTDKGFVTKGSNSTITATVMSKTNSGLLPINDKLPSGMTIEVYGDTTNELLTSGTSSSLTYNYEGVENFNEIDFRLKLNNELYDNVNVEVKNKIKGFGNLDLTPLELIIYIDNNNKPLITSTTLNGSFIYDGKNIGLQNSGLTITSTTNDFSVNVKANDSLELIFNSDATICGNTKESYTINCEYEGCEYDKNIYINYVKSDLTVNALYDTLYIPYDITSQYYTIELNTDVSYNGVYVTNECILSSIEDIKFNQRGGKWCINIPKKYYDNTGLTISYNYNNIIANKEYTIVRRGDYNSFFINAYPQRINGDATIEVYITKNSYDGEYVSMDENNLKLKYIIDNEQEQDYVIENAPKEHGNIAFYPNGKIYIKNDVSYTQEPIYNRIQFNLYGADNKLKASEIIERVDIIGNYEIKHITSSGLYIDPKDIFKEFNVDEYDIIVKEL